MGIGAGSFLTTDISPSLSLADISLEKGGERRENREPLHNSGRSTGLYCIYRAVANRRQRQNNNTRQAVKRIDTSSTNTYVALKLEELQKRFEEIGDDDLSVLTLEEPGSTDESHCDDYNPYNRC